MIFYTDSKAAQKAHKRFINEIKAYNINPHVSEIDPKVLAKQEEATKRICNFAREIDSPMDEELIGFARHEHLCTFKMLSNDKPLQAKQCREWRATHPINFPEDYEPEYLEDCCDYCPMMNYVALDDEGKIMYVNRLFPQK